MPRVSRTSKKRNDVEELYSEDEDNPPSTSRSNKRNSRLTQSQNIHSQTSQLSMSQMSQTQEPLSDEELHKLAAVCTNFFLVANCKKAPVKRADIGKLIPKQYSRKFSDIMKAASEKLEMVFGYKIKEVEKNTFLLVNSLDISAILQNSLPVKVEPHESALTILRTSILATILMSGGVLHESVLAEFVANFGLDVNSKDIHPLLGSIQKLVYQDFVRQGYLSVNVVRDMDPSYREIRWGARATAELDKRDVIKFVCKIYGESFQPQMWEEQWRHANEECEIVEE